MTKSVQKVATLNERALLDELNHRINNEFASAINLVSVSALRSSNVSVKAALGNVVELLHGLADVNRALKRRMPMLSLMRQNTFILFAAQ